METNLPMPSSEPPGGACPVNQLERRQWPRVPASVLSDVTASIVAGPPVKVVNVSRGGALLESSARPKNAAVRLRLTRPTGTTTVLAGSVKWSRVASIAPGHINYVVAVSFDEPLDLEQAFGLSTAAEQAAVAEPPVAVTTPAVLTSADVPGSEMEDAHLRWEEERIRLVQKLAEATERIDALQAAMQSQAQEQGEAIAKQKGRYEDLIAELVQVSRDRQPASALLSMQWRGEPHTAARRPVASA